MESIYEIRNAIVALEQYASRCDDDGFFTAINALEDAANTVGKSWSGSWLGYHSGIYYRDLKVPPPQHQFSPEWGMIERVTSGGTYGDWVRYDYDIVVKAIQEDAGNPDLSTIQKESDAASEAFEDAQSRIRSVLSTINSEPPVDGFLAELENNIQELEIYTEGKFIRHWQPSGQQVTRDSLAASQGMKVPPHYTVLANIQAIKHSFNACLNLVKLGRRAASHLENKRDKAAGDIRIGTNIFIGHGRAQAWRDLKDFVSDRLHLPYDEFNRVPVAGVTNIARLNEMLDQAAIAFLVMTAEDEQADGQHHARMNVIHEAGLFQGRLGFTRAIILLEEGCEPFSNIDGLGQIRFPAGDISAKYEEIRRVLEREGIIEEE